MWILNRKYTDSRDISNGYQFCASELDNRLQAVNGVDVQLENFVWLQI